MHTLMLMQATLIKLSESKKKKKSCWRNEEFQWEGVNEWKHCGMKMTKFALKMFAIINKNNKTQSLGDLTQNKSESGYQRERKQRLRTE